LEKEKPGNSAIVTFLGCLSKWPFQSKVESSFPHQSQVKMGPTDGKNDSNPLPNAPTQKTSENQLAKTRDWKPFNHLKKLAMFFKK